MPAFQDSLPEPTEGWGLIRPGDRKAHYYRNTDSLCRRIGLYSGPLEPDENHSPDDCAACRKVLDKENAEQGFPGPEHMEQMVKDSRDEKESGL